ncbi:MAG: hypothetical protein JKY93_03090 [Gammaproteobacteria bacterium]|nr:hypothetical protein [Gammaproteobacteria bacterium]
MKLHIKICLLIVGLLGSSIALAQMPQRTAKHVNFIDRKSGRVITGTDTGRFQSFENNAVIVEDGTDDTIICRFRSPSGNCYRLSVNDGGGHVPVVLIDRDTFDNAADAFRARDNWGICEIIDNPWSAWSIRGSMPTAPGTHNYTEERFCSAGGVGEACADTCPVPIEARVGTVTNPAASIPIVYVPPPIVDPYVPPTVDPYVPPVYVPPTVDPYVPPVYVSPTVEPYVPPVVIVTHGDPFEPEVTVPTAPVIPPMFVSNLHCHSVFGTPTPGGGPVFGSGTFFSLDCHDGHANDAGDMVIVGGW